MELIDKKVNEILNQELGISAYEMALPRKKVIDKQAAVIILQSYLDRHRG